MKKNIFLVLLFVLFIVNVSASNVPIISHKVMVTNKEGTICYKDKEKTNVVIPYKTTLTADYDIEGSYIYVYNDDYQCNVKYSDVSSVSQSFDINNTEIENIQLQKVIILAKGGLNLRKGPSVTYSKITTIPQNTVLSVSKKAGKYWYYVEYNGHSGWITMMNKYVGFEDDKVLINYQKINIYDTSGKIVGSISSNTEISNYLVVYDESDMGYYVLYNGIKGYVNKDNMLYKVNSPGKIRLTEDYIIYDSNHNPTKKIVANQELEYTMINNSKSDYVLLYVPSKDLEMKLEDNFEYTKEAKISIKKDGYLGEGLFGEEKFQREVVEEIEEEPTENSENKPSNTRKYIIIGLIIGIILSLLLIIIILLRNNKRNKIANRNILENQDYNNKV